MPVSVLLRDGPHASATTRFGLKVEQFSISIAKTPIQIPIPQQSPEIIDLGIFRPSITISGVVENEPESIYRNYTEAETDEEDEEFELINPFMITEAMGSVENEPEDISNTSNTPTGSRGTPSFTYSGQTYYFPYKNFLEQQVVKWVASEDTLLQVEIGDTTTPLSTSSANSTGGGLYIVAIQQSQFSQEPAKEDRWNFTLQFVAKARSDIAF